MDANYEEPQIGKRYLVITARTEKKNKFVGRTGIAIEKHENHPYKYLNCIIQFDDEALEDYNVWEGPFIWHTGVETILLEDQDYMR